jgi:hypothetical protein
VLRPGSILLLLVLGACAYDASGVDPPIVDEEPEPDAAPAPPDAAPPSPPDAAPPEPPSDVTFGSQVKPMFARRGCVPCHAGPGAGHTVGGLKLDGDDSNTYKELTQEISRTYHVARVSLDAPESSLLLTLPLLEDPPDSHPIAVFTSTSDPDYLLLLGWIRQGAPHN